MDLKLYIERLNRAAWFILCSMRKEILLSNEEMKSILHLTQKFSNKAKLSNVDIKYMDDYISKINLSDVKKDMKISDDIARFIGDLRFVKLSVNSMKYVEDLCTRIEKSLIISSSTIEYFKKFITKLHKDERTHNYVNRMYVKTNIFVNSKFMNITRWENENKKRYLIQKYIFVRVILRDMVKNINILYIDRLRFAQLMNTLPLNSVSVRAINRCYDGSTRSYCRKLGLKRQSINAMHGLGLVPGLVSR